MKTFTLKISKYTGSDCKYIIEAFDLSGKFISRMWCEGMIGSENQHIFSLIERMTERLSNNNSKQLLQTLTINI